MARRKPDTQLSLFDTVSAGYAAEREPETADEQQARQQAYDAWHVDFFQRFYTAERVADILNSGDEVRITNYQALLHRQQRG